MARTRAKKGLTVVCAALLLPVPILAAAAKSSSGSSTGDGTIVYDADSEVVDAKNNTVDFKHIAVTWRDIKVEADHARAAGHDTENNRWTFEGNVRIQSDRGDLHADRAVVEFKNGEIVKATVTGNPAEFEQKPGASDRPAHGHSHEIVYDVAEQTLRLSGDAQLFVGRDKISAPQLEYNILTQSYTAAKEPGTDSRVHGVISPPSKEPETKP